MIGAGGNSFSEIRKMKQKRPIKTRSLTDVLSPIKPTPIEINIFRNGTIQVWVIGKPIPLLTAFDRDLVTVNYLSFCSWGTAMGKWFYDCPNDNLVSDSLEDDEIRNLTLTPHEWLIRNLNEINYAMPLSTVHDNLIVETLFILRQSHYVSKNSQLISRVAFILKWEDTRLEWDTAEFDDIPEMRFSITNSTWIPPLRLLK